MLSTGVVMVVLTDADKSSAPNPLPFGSSVLALFRWFLITMVQVHLRFRYSWILAKGITDFRLSVTFFRPALPI
jgi:hypothetical protein